MGRSNRGDKEYSRLQQALYENGKLKREISSLRKQLARLDLDRHSYVKDLVEKSYELEEELEGKKVLKKLEKQWTCHECARGILEIHIYTKPEGPWYYRRCSNCAHRTKSQPYVQAVSGILKRDKE